ncbi:origin recognition complex subunit 2-domain-containing protein [Diplogelasinospora grovesii]|uniref:Origin recognition complex subunit 2 n=1 Tax=Diplogelasinospora grovesii TaxID=303347 RepID=A0AAN6NG32_9PEZI|nr:origin recognition complex subunit 2-domain-containing protein [Diplogelasinospora grovesii]
MPRKKATITDEEPVGRSMRKRERPVDPYEIPDEDDETPPKRRRALKITQPEEETEEEAAQVAAESTDEPSPAPTPTPKRRPGRPRKVPLPEDANGEATTPSTVRQKKIFATPVKLKGLNGVDTPSRRNIADRSARRKSARALIDRVLGDAVSDDDEGAEDGVIAREIYESSEDEDEENQTGVDGEDDEEEGPDITATPSKRTPGRPRNTATTPNKRRKRSPTPPRDLPPHEQYFYQNKPGLAKTSNNNLAGLNLLTHDEYFQILHGLTDPHADDVKFLQSLHAESFPQWAFELSQGFSACLYGYGSKRRLLHQFATYLSTTHSRSKIVVINGYVRTISIREILSTLASAIDPLYKLPSGNPVMMVQTLLSLLSSSSTPLTLIINSIDSPPLRKTSTQSILSQLASHQKIHLACSTDTPDFPLMWDSGLRSSFNFVFHDCTTFAPFSAEIDVVDEVHELLGRTGRRAGGKEGVTFVLRSLPENAKNLFRLLVGEVLAMMEDNGDDNGEGVGMEYRMLYNKAVEEFICSSEMAFRTLLKEFHDHQMITSRKDSIGTELLSLPFRKDELEGILEDLMS